MGYQMVGSPRAHEVLIPEIDVLFLSDKNVQSLSFARFLRQGQDVAGEKVEWLDDSLPAITLSLTASGAGADWDTNNDITGLPVADAERAKLRVGTVLELASGEHVIVASINDTADTIDLHVKRGWGSTTAAAQGTVAFTARIIGNAQIDGSNPIDPSYKAPTEVYNYTQGFERDFAIGGKLLRSRVGMGAEVARQRRITLGALLAEWNSAIIYGSREKSSELATMQGLRNIATTTYNVNGALTEVKLYAALIAMIDAGGYPSAIHGSATMIARIEMLLSSMVTSGLSEYNAKLTVKYLDILDHKVELHIDRQMISTEFLVVDYDRITKHNQSANGNSGEFSSYIIENNGKQYKEQVVGYKTLKVTQAAAAIVRAYGCTG